jgi:hypothetical protein
MKIDRSDSEHHGFHGIGIKSGVAGGEDAAFANAQEAHIIDFVSLRDYPHTFC